MKIPAHWRDGWHVNNNKKKKQESGAGVIYCRYWPLRQNNVSHLGETLCNWEERDVLGSFQHLMAI